MPGSRGRLTSFLQAPELACIIVDSVIDGEWYDVHASVQNSTAVSHSPYAQNVALQHRQSDRGTCNGSMQATWMSSFRRGALLVVHVLNG